MTLAKSLNNKHIYKISNVGTYLSCTLYVRLYASSTCVATTNLLWDTSSSGGHREKSSIVSWLTNSALVYEPK
jgi:hypothetical protein